jgi:hypothetical protein
LRRLEVADRRLLLEAVAFLVGIRLALRILGFRRVYGALDRVRSIRARRGAAIQTSGGVIPVTRSVDRAARHVPFATTCLHRSLALWWMLGRRGLGGELRFGARKQQGRLEAHAWVEYGGLALNEDPALERGYVPLAWIPAERDA